MFDPSCSGQAVLKNLREAAESPSARRGGPGSNGKWLRQVRKAVSSQTRSQYQVVYVRVGFMSPAEREQSKRLVGERPQ